MDAEKNLQKIAELLAIMDEQVSKEDFIQSFELIMDIVKKSLQLTEEKASELDSFVRQSVDKMQDDQFSAYSDLRKQVEKTDNTFLTKAVDQMKDQMKSEHFESVSILTKKVEDKLETVKDGEPPTDRKIITLIKPLIPLAKQGSPDTANQIRDKLETLNDDQKLRIESIYQLEERLDKIEKRPVGGRGGGGYSVIAAESHIVDDETPTGSVNDTNTVFTLKNRPSPIASLKVYLNGQRVRITEDYTFSGVTITFLSAPLTSSIILVDYRI